MFKNYLVIAWRNLANNPLFSLINVFGLAIGLSCCIIIALFVSYETSYDQQFANKENIYRVVRDFYGNNLELAAVAPPIGPLLKEDFQEVEDVVRILSLGSATLTIGDQSFVEEHMVIADTNLFEFFALEFVAGDPEYALALPTNIVLTERAATRYFGNADPMGKSMFFMGQVDVVVAGVIKDLPENTHMSFEIVGSIESIPLLMGAEELESWGSNNYYTYIRTPDGFDPLAFEGKLPDFLIKHTDENAPDGNQLLLQKLTDIHLHSNRDSEWRSNGSITIVYTFSAIAVVILLIACINFMNLTTARSTQRAREVGVRKVVGAHRSQLVAQFLSESLLLTGFAMLLAVALVELLLPLFANFIEKPLVLDLVSNAWILVLGIAIVGLFAGSYPAFYLSHFRPAEVLKGKTNSAGGASIRRVLVVFQFAMSIALLIATGIVLTQMQYARDIDLGYDKTRNLTTRLPYFLPLWETYEPLKIELESHPDILSVVYSSRVPSMQNLDGSGYLKAGDPIDMDNIAAIADLKVDYQWFEHYDVNLLAGRYFRENERRIEMPSEDKPITLGAAILNETAAKRFGWTAQEAVGQILRQPMSRDLTTFVDRTIVGVVEDIHFSSLHDEIKGTVFAEPNPQYGRSISVKLAAGDHTSAIEHFEKTWQGLIPSEPVRWQFLDDRFDALYRSEERQAQLFGMFAALAVVVATLGLFGLASFTTERRTKEIGIRKVLGAKVGDIVLLLTTDFTKLVLIANIIAWPVAYLGMQDWLTRFVYQAPFAQWWWLFFVAGGLALVIAWLTIAAQATRAATSRPVLALRYE